MPRTAAPLTARSGTLHARRGPPVPINPTVLLAGLGATDLPAPLAVVRPQPLSAGRRQAGHAMAAVIGKLDGGRLYSTELVAAGGWEPHQALHADVSCSGRVRRFCSIT